MKSAHKLACLLLLAIATSASVPLLDDDIGTEIFHDSTHSSTQANSTSFMSTSHPNQQSSTLSRPSALLANCAPSSM